MQLYFNPRSARRPSATVVYNLSRWHDVRSSCREPLLATQALIAQNPNHKQATDRLSLVDLFVQRRKSVRALFGLLLTLMMTVTAVQNRTGS